MNAISGIVKPSEQMPILFVGHGSPMNAIDDNSYHRSWTELGKNLPHPEAILSISAHWLTKGTMITAMTHPQTIHDFGGFPKELFHQQYPAHGSPDLATAIQKMNTFSPIDLDFSWGLDHGTWSVLKPMFPQADIPVIQLSIDYSKPPQFHFELAKQLSKLRKQGVMIMGSGNIVHNLSQLRADEFVPDWAKEFDDQIVQWIETGDDKSVIDFQKLGSLAKMAHPTYDHFLPLLYILGLKTETDEPEFFNTDFQLGSISMRSVIWK